MGEYKNEKEMWKNERIRSDKIREKCYEDEEKKMRKLRWENIRKNKDDNEWSEIKEE